MTGARRRTTDLQSNALTTTQPRAHIGVETFSNLSRACMHTYVLTHQAHIWKFLKSVCKHMPVYAEAYFYAIFKNPVTSFSKQGLSHITLGIIGFFIASVG